MEWSDDIKELFTNVIVLYERLDKLKGLHSPDERPEEVSMVIKALEFRLAKIKKQIADLD